MQIISIHGIPFFANSTSRVAKVLWGILLLIVSAAILQHVYIHINKYLQYPKQVYTDIGIDKPPYVSICKKLRLSDLEGTTDFSSKISEYENFLSNFDEINKDVIMVIEEQGLKKLENSGTAKFLESIKEDYFQTEAAILVNLGYSGVNLNQNDPPKLIAKCKINGKPCQKELFRKVTSTTGLDQCYTANLTSSKVYLELSLSVDKGAAALESLDLKTSPIEELKDVFLIVHRDNLISPGSLLHNKKPLIPGYVNFLTTKVGGEIFRHKPNAPVTAICSKKDPMIRHLAWSMDSINGGAICFQMPDICLVCMTSLVTIEYNGWEFYLNSGKS